MDEGRRGRTGGGAAEVVQSRALAPPVVENQLSQPSRPGCRLGRLPSASTLDWRTLASGSDCESADVVVRHECSSSIAEANWASLRVPQAREGSSELAPSSRSCSSSDAGARGWTVDASARICTRERRPLSFGAPSRAASSGCPTRTRRISAVARLTARVSGVGWSGLRIILRRAAVAAAARALRLRSLLRSGGANRVAPRSPLTPAQPTAPKPISLPSRSR
jgi:hypothetical protein